jgi:hypothetical protein
VIRCRGCCRLFASMSGVRGGTTGEFCRGRCGNKVGVLLELSECRWSSAPSGQGVEEGRLQALRPNRETAPAAVPSEQTMPRIAKCADQRRLQLPFVWATCRRFP